jgi:anaerobic magnesium-protoporphyrin IX monomethyl ester cyclase
MNILFTHSYFLHFDEKQLDQGKPYPPLGTIQAAACLRKNNYNTALFDTNFVKNPLEIVDTLRSFKPEILVIYDDGFNYLTKMCLTRMRDAAFSMIKVAKEFNIHVIVSSSDSTDHFEKYLTAGADEIILGEGEITLMELVNAVEKKKDISNIPGIAYKGDGGVIKTKPREILRDLDSLPLPAWDLINIDPYKIIWRKHGIFTINIATTRGCPYKCNWCAKPIYGYSYHSRTPKHVIAEIKLIKSLFDFDYIWFCDDIFGLKPSWVKEFNNELKSENITIKYKIQSRADLLLKDDTLMVLAQSGCDEIWIGAESGSQKILDAMDKGSTVAQIEQSTMLMKKFGIKPGFFLQFGYLTENWEDIKATLNMLFRLMPHDIGVSVSYPLPGTKFHETVKSQLQKKTNWTDSDELLLMYKNTYPPIFYKKLHRFIHKRFRQKQAIEAVNQGKLRSIIRWAYFKLVSNLLYTQLLQLKK